MAGMLVGLGFAFIENWALGNGMLASGAYDGAAEVDKIGEVGEWIVSRGILDGPWGHSTFTAISALGIVYFLARRADRSLGRRVAVAVGAYLLGVLAHVGNNTAVTVFEGQVVVGYAYALAMLGVLLGLIRHARRAERRWWATTMGERLGTGVVTDDELTALATRRSRRLAVAAARRSGGRAAAARVTALQRAQIGYANAVAAAGSDTGADAAAGDPGDPGGPDADGGERAELARAIHHQRASIAAD